MDQVEIRAARKTDAPIIASLGHRTFTETFGHLFRDLKDLQHYCRQTFSDSKIESSLAKTENMFWIAFAGDKPIGYAKLKLYSDSEFISSSAVCQLQKIYVLREFLSKKAGYKLQLLLLQKAISKGCKTIWLSVLDGNKRAIQFYKNNGFNPIGKHNFHIGKEHFDFIVMSKDLKEKSGD